MWRIFSVDTRTNVCYNELWRLGLEIVWYVGALILVVAVMKPIMSIVASIIISSIEEVGE